MAAKLSQTQILQQLGVPTTQAELNDIEGNGRLQQAINIQAARKGLPEPFNPSTASAIIQDLLPVAAIAGAGAAAGDAAAAEKIAGEKAAGESAAGSSAARSAASSAASSAAKTLAKAGLAAALGANSDIEKMLIRGLEALVGVALILLGLSALAGGSGNPVTAVKSAAATGARFF